jgi:hypothetical protein
LNSGTGGISYVIGLGSVIEWISKGIRLGSGIGLRSGIGFGSRIGRTFPGI